MPDTPAARSRVPAAVVTALVHAFVWWLLIAWALRVVPLARDTFGQSQMKLPVLTEVVLSWPLASLDLGPPTIAAFVLAVLADIAVLAWLDRPGGRPVLRELWSAVMVGVPVVLLFLATQAALLPFVKLAEGLTRATHDRTGVVQKEIDRLQGEWAVVRTERNGKDVPADQSDLRTLTVRENHFTWDGSGGQAMGTFYALPFHRPMEITFVHTNGPRQGEYQQGVYRLDGDRLTICLAPTLATGDELPNDFTTAGTKRTLYVFERVKKAE